MKWSESEFNFLKENYPKDVPLSEIAEKLNRSVKSVHRKAQEEKLSRPWRRFNKPVKNYTKQEIDKRYYQKNKTKVYKRKMHRRKRLKEEAIKLFGSKCSKCGYNKCISALEFHHNKTNKEGNVSTLLKNGSRQKLLKEAEKCILLCANCHRETHSKGA